jgi:hypothetical protein
MTNLPDVSEDEIERFLSGSREKPATFYLAVCVMHAVQNKSRGVVQGGGQRAQQTFPEAHFQTLSEAFLAGFTGRLEEKPISPLQLFRAYRIDEDPLMGEMVDGTPLNSPEYIERIADQVIRDVADVCAASLASDKVKGRSTVLRLAKSLSSRMAMILKKAQPKRFDDMTRNERHDLLDRISDVDPGIRGRLDAALEESKFPMPHEREMQVLETMRLLQTSSAVLFDRPEEQPAVTLTRENFEWVSRLAHCE